MAHLTRRDLFRRGSIGLATAGVAGWLLRSDARATPPSGDLGDYALYLQNEAPGSAGSAVASANEGTPAEPANWAATEDNILGPYHRPGAPYRAKITPPLAAGDVLVITGRVWGLDKRRPLASATLDIWQADRHGRYDNDDPKNPPAKGVFKYRARMIADEQGYYEYETIQPGRYQVGRDSWRPAHIHYMVKHPGYKTLVTQLYFRGDPMNDKDQFIKPSLIIDLQKVEVKEGVYQIGTFDIVLAPE